MSKLQAPQAAGFNAGKNMYAKPVKVDDIVIDPEIAAIFPISDKIRDEIAADIIANGYDKSQPVVLWKDKLIMADGHTRLASAKQAGLTEVPAVEKDFAGRDELILYTFQRQVIRRNLTGAEILAAAQMLPNKKAANGDGCVAKILANKLGISESTVNQARAILKEAPDKIKEEADKIVNEVKAGNISIKKGSQLRRELNKPKKTLSGIEDEIEEIEYVNENEPKVKAVFCKNTLPISIMERDKLFVSVIQVLVEKEQIEAIELIVNHFYMESERMDFITLLPESVLVSLPFLYQYINSPQLAR